MTIIDNTDRFRDNSDRYARFRPRYPDGIVRALADRIAAVPAPQGRPVLDVGSGTGIFTRQLTTWLPAGTPVLGIEPAGAMRARAEATPARVRYRPGKAEVLPVGDGAARAVVAATAAHWFGRPVFYREARRVLPIGGLLAVVEYIWDETESAAARAVVSFLARYGEKRAYARPDYVAELAGLAGFGDVAMAQERVTLRLSLADFAGLALSSSHARPVLATLGRDAAEAMVQVIGAPLADADGMVPFGYLFQAFAVTRV